MFVAHLENKVQQTMAPDKTLTSEQHCYPLDHTQCRSHATCQLTEQVVGERNEQVVCPESSREAW